MIRNSVLRPGCGRKKFVAVDASRDASASVVRLDRIICAKATDMHIAGHGDLARQSKNNSMEPSPASNSASIMKVKAAETDVPRLSLPFVPPSGPLPGS